MQQNQVKTRFEEMVRIFKKSNPTKEQLEKFIQEKKDEAFNQFGVKIEGQPKNEIHFFSEVSLDISQEAKIVYERLFNICEDIGFMPSKEKYGFSVVGPFNIPDVFDLEMQFQVKKNDEGKFFVTDVRAVLRNNETRELKQTWDIVKDGQETDEVKRPML